MINILTLLLDNIDVIFSLIDRCTTDPGALPEGAQTHRSSMFYQFRNPGPRAVLRMGREIRRQKGWSRMEWRANRASTFRSIREECASLTDEDCQDLYDEWREDRGDLQPGDVQ